MPTIMGTNDDVVWEDEAENHLEGNEENDQEDYLLWR